MKFIVPSGPGGTIDPLGRFLADTYTKSFGQNFVIDNRPGAQGNTGIALIAKAEPDGYTIGIAASSMIAINPHLYAAMPYDPRKELTGIVLVGDVPNILVVHPDVPVKTLAFVLAVLFSCGAQAQTWPAKPVRFIVPAGPGGTIDPLSRFLAEAYTKRFGQTFVVENRPGAQGNTGLAAIAKSEGDGYTIGMAASSMIAINPHVYASMP